MRLIGYIPPFTDYSFCIPVYTDRKKYLYYHKTDDHFCIFRFDRIYDDTLSFIPYQSKKYFNVADIAPILFYTRKNDKIICDKADKAVIKICDILYRTDKPRKYIQEEVLSVDKELGVNLNYYKIRFQMNNYAYKHFPHNYKQIQEIQFFIDSFLKKGKSKEKISSEKLHIEIAKIKNMRASIVGHAVKGNITDVIEELHSLMKLQSKIGSVEEIADSLTKISSSLKNTGQNDFTGMFTFLSSHFVNKKSVQNDKFEKSIKKYRIRSRRFPRFKSGDTITVAYREGRVNTVSKFCGVVIKLENGTRKRFTVREISDNVGVERIFPLESPLIDNITINKTGRIRRVNFYYLRNQAAKKNRLKRGRFNLRNVK